jgi:hypothetical protein
VELDSRKNGRFQQPTHIVNFLSFIYIDINDENGCHLVLIALVFKTCLKNSTQEAETGLLVQAFGVRGGS